MESTEQNTLVFKDQAGEYYLLPQALLECGRVPAEHATELERLIAAATQDGTGGNDAEGYIWPYFVITGAAIATHYAVALYADSRSREAVREIVPVLNFAGSSEPFAIRGRGSFAW